MNETFSKGLFFVHILLFSSFILNTQAISVCHSQTVEGNVDLKRAEAYISGFQEHILSHLTQARNAAVLTAPQPVSGILDVLAIPVRFSDFSNTSSIANIVSQKLNTTSSYYAEVSYGSVSLNFSTLSFWTTLPHSHNYYGSDVGSQIDVNVNAFISDALSLAGPYVNYHNFGYVMLIHAGNDEAQSANPSDIWSQASPGKEYYPSAGADLGLAIVAENDPYGTFAHEFGHNLGLLDLYDYYPPAGLVGDDFVADWSLMGGGNWLNPPSSMMAPEKMWLDWISESNVTQVEEGQILNVGLSRLETPGQILAAKIPVNTTYYVVEYRSKTLTDSALPVEGVVISYVDESKESGQGPVRVQDSHPSSKTLDDAAFLGGERFVDEANQVAIKVWSLGSDNANVTVQKGFADLSVDQIQIVGEPVEGQDIYFNVYVRNTGVTASNPALLSLSINGTTFGTKELQFVTPNSTVLVQIGPWQAKSGLNQIQATADVNGDVVESNKTNNVMFTSLNVYPAHTIIIDQAKVSRTRASVSSSQLVYFHAEWSDNGSSIVDGTLHVNGSAYEINSTGWVSFETTSTSVGDVFYQVTAAVSDGFTSFVQQVTSPHIVWDTLEVYDSGASKSRCNVDSTQTIWVRLQYAYDKSIFDNASGTLNIGGEPAGWNAENGYWYTIDSQQAVGLINYTAPSSFEDNLYGLTSALNASNISIIWDRIAIALSPMEQRVNVGSLAGFEVNGTYEYDSAPWNGALTFNDTLTKSEVGIFAYDIVSMTDPLYGLTAFESNVAYVIFDRVNLNLTSLNERVSIGGNARISVTGLHEYDNSVWNGTVAFNDTLTKNSVGNNSVTVTAITDEQYSVTAFESNSVSLVWDQVNITLYTSHTRIGFKSNATISWTGVYEYDGKPFAGNITLNDDLAKNAVGSVIYQVENISDSLYGLAAFTSNSVRIVFDDIAYVTKLKTAMPGGATVEIDLTYKSDGTPVTDANVTVGTAQAENTGKGSYVAAISEWTPYTVSNVDIRTGSMTKNFDLSLILIGNSVIIGFVATVAIGSAILFARHRKLKQ